MEGVLPALQRPEGKVEEGMDGCVMRTRDSKL